MSDRAFRESVGDALLEDVGLNLAYLRRVWLCTQARHKEMVLCG